MALAVGDRAEFSMPIGKHHLVSQIFAEEGVGSDMPGVLSTAYMIGIMEWGCLEQMRPHLEDGQVSLGVKIDVTHTAPTLQGMTMTVTSEVTAVEGRQIEFKVAMRDEAGEIGEGRHRRAIVDKSRFEDKAAARRADA
ncbi:thioesterase family protein [Paracoccaceae bacterium GXU_MW_L88]